MPSLTREHLKAKRDIPQVTSLALGHRFAKLKTEHGLSASASRPVLGKAIAQRTAGRPWSSRTTPTWPTCRNGFRQPSRRRGFRFSAGVATTCN